MSALRFKQVDVFTKQPFRGNPVAVVLDGAKLSDAEMQRIAAWTNLSETTFVLPPSDAGSGAAADYRLRIFTPRAELPFAGHPTLGSAHAVLEAGIAKAKDGVLRQECGAGVLELKVEKSMLWLKAPQATGIAVSKTDIAKLEKALGAGVLGKPMIVSVGPIWLVAELAKRSDVARLKPDMDAIGKLTDHLECTGITVFGASEAGRAGERKAAMEVRSFAPAHGIPEDPVCGSGNVSVAHYLSKSEGLQRYGQTYQARQGMQVGRSGRVSIRVEGGQIYLGGSAVTCVEGSLNTAARASA